MDRCRNRWFGSVVAVFLWIGPGAAAAQSGAGGDLWSRSAGAAQLRLMDVSLDVLASAGSSSAEGENLAQLQGGGHDPRRRGFNLNQVELSFQGAVDPYLRGDAYLVFFLDPEGESRFELEEAFLTSQSLPFGLQDRGLQVEAGTFLTRFGRMNGQHPHFWRWQDQPVVMSRFFGEDGLRGPGVSTSWLTPLPWFSELRASMQQASGETQVSFASSEEAPPVAGRPFVERGVHDLGDFTWLLRWSNGLDLSDTWSGQLGLSALFGPNATGADGQTRIYGSDLVVKWRPLTAERGWPFVLFEAEGLYRDTRAAGFDGDVLDPNGSPIPISLPAADLDDWGMYVQGLWGFRRGFAAGLRYEFAEGGGAPSTAFGSAIAIAEDPFRARRQRISPLLAWHPSEYSRLRLQYNFDRSDYARHDDVHSLWLGVEFSLGAHPAHSY